MKTLLCTALVVLSVSVCGAQQTPPAADPAPPAVPGIPNPPQVARPNSPAGPALCQNENRSPLSQVVLLNTPWSRTLKGKKGFCREFSLAGFSAKFYLDDVVVEGALLHNSGKCLILL